MQAAGGIREVQRSVRPGRTAGCQHDQRAGLFGRTFAASFSCEAKLARGLLFLVSSTISSPSIPSRLPRKPHSFIHDPLLS